MGVNDVNTNTQGTQQWGTFADPNASVDTSVPAPSTENIKYQSTIQTSADGTETVSFDYYYDQPQLDAPGTTDPLYLSSSSLQVTGTPDQIAQQMNQYAASAFGTLETQTVTDPTILAMSAKAKVPPFYVSASIAKSGQQALDSALGNLSPDLAAKIKAALAYPDFAATLSPSEQATLSDVQSQIAAAENTEAASYQVTIPAGWATPTLDMTKMRAEVSYNFDETFKTAVNGYSGLTDVQKNQLLLLHYNPPGVTMPTDPAVLSAFAAINQQVAGQLPLGGWTPPADNPDYYNEVLNGAFSNALLNAENASTPPLTQDQQNLISQWGSAYLANPDDSSIPSDAKTLIQTLVATATQSVISAYGLDPGWEPTVTTLSIDPATATAFGAISTAQGLVADMTSTVNGMPDSPEKTAYLHYLSTISAALNSLIETIYSLQGAQTEASTQLNQIKLAIQKADYDQQVKAQADAAAKQKDQDDSKLADMPPGLQTFCKVMQDAMIVAVGLFLAPFTLGASLALTIAYVVAENTQPELIAEAFTAINTAVGADDYLSEAIVSTITCLILTMLNPMIGIQELCGTNANVFYDYGKACGESDADAKQNAMIAGIVLQATIMVVMIVASCGSDIAAAVTMAARSVVSALSDAGAAIAQASLSSLARAAASGVVSALKAVPSVLTELVADAARGVVAIGDDMVSIASTVADVAKSTFEAMKNTLMAMRQLGLSDTFEYLATEGLTLMSKMSGAPRAWMADLEQAIRDNPDAYFIKFANQVAMTSNVATSTIQGLTALNQSNIDKMQGDIAFIQAQAESQSEKLQAIIKMIQKCIDSLLAALDKNGSEIVAIGKVKADAVNLMQEMTSSITIAYKG